MGRGNGFLGKRFVLPAFFPAIDIGPIKLPALARLVQTLEKPLAMLILRQVEPDLDHRGALFHEMILEVPDGAVTVFPVIAVCFMNRPDPFCDHSLMMAAIEGDHLTKAGQKRRDPPEKVMAGFGPPRPAERPGMETSGVGVGCQSTDQAVFSTGVRAVGNQ